MVPSQHAHRIMLECHQRVVLNKANANLMAPDPHHMVPACKSCCGPYYAWLTPHLSMIQMILCVVLFVTMLTWKMNMDMALAITPVLIALYQIVVQADIASVTSIYSAPLRNGIPRYKCVSRMEKQYQYLPLVMSNCLLWMRKATRIILYCQIACIFQHSHATYYPSSNYGSAIESKHVLAIETSSACQMAQSRFSTMEVTKTSPCMPLMDLTTKYSIGGMAIVDNGVCAWHHVYALHQTSCVSTRDQVPANVMLVNKGVKPNGDLEHTNFTSTTAVLRSNPKSNFPISDNAFLPTSAKVFHPLYLANSNMPYVLLTLQRALRQSIFSIPRAVLKYCKHYKNSNVSINIGYLMERWKNGIATMAENLPQATLMTFVKRWPSSALSQFHHI